MTGPTSAGLLLYRRTDPAGRSGSASIEVLIAKMGGPFWSSKVEHCWSVPKGLRDEADVDDLATATREFCEEMGSPPPDAPTISLGTTTSGKKTIVVFAREGEFDANSATSNTFEMEWPPRSGRMQIFPEIDSAAWVEPAEATTLLVKSQAIFVERLIAAVCESDRG